MQLTTPLVGAVFGIGAILSSCAGEAAPESDQTFTNSDAAVGAATAALHDGMPEDTVGKSSSARQTP